MAEDDIYGNKGKYEHFKLRYRQYLAEPRQRIYERGSVGKYVCKVTSNLNYFEKLFTHFESRDISFVRRNRLIHSMRFICNFIGKDLSECDRDDISRLAATAHTVYKTPKSKQTFICDLKHMFRILLPEKDEKGRPDDTLVPYPVRHISGKLDRSVEKLRKDKLTWEEFESVVNYFGSDPRIQCYLTLSLESLARPQELLYRRIENIELHDNYAKVYLTDHGKEGPGLLQCIDSYPYLVKWLELHPQKSNPDAFLFINTGATKRCRQLKPTNINEKLRQACRDLGITKRITCYSLKRSGVSIRRLRGESDMEIQHAARWATTRQLHTYDLSTQEEAFRLELEKRGMIQSTSKTTPAVKRCEFCNRVAPFGDVFCPQCKRPLDRKVILKEEDEKTGEIRQLREELLNLKQQFELVKNQAMHGMMLEILENTPGKKTLKHIRAAVSDCSASRN